MKQITFNRGKFILGILFAVLSLIITLLYGFSITACLVFVLLFLIVGSISFTMDVPWWLHSICLLAISAAEVVCIQTLLNAGMGESLGIFMLNVLLVAVFTEFIYMISANFHVSAGLGFFLPLLLATVNYYVYLFRGTELQPTDLLSIVTALNVVDSYKIELMPTVFYAWEMAMLLFICCFYISDKDRKRSRWKRRAVLLAVEVCLILIAIAGTQPLKSRHWNAEGSISNGYVLNFLLQVREALVTKPNGYSSSLIAEYESEYVNTGTSRSSEESENGEASESGETSESDETPAIIVIMDESFSDLSVLGSEIQTNIEVTPFLDSLTENTIRGYALSSVYGGSTPNSEFEFLTGFTMAFLPAGSIPYQQYIKTELPSLVSTLNSMGFYSFATHPSLSSGWMRTIVYPLLQFATWTFVEDYPQTNLIRDLTSDQEMFERVIEYYEDRDESQGFFLFGVTLQNHGGYARDDYETSVSLEGYEGEYADVEQYLSLIHETDQAVEYLISYFEEVDEPVVILFYGDHQPNLDSAFLEEVHGGGFDTLDEQELKYIIPFFIWANYDIEEEQVELTSINYLSTYLMEVAGLDKTAYQQFLTDTREVIPALNAYGYYSVSNGCFMDIDDAEEGEAEALLKYQQIQYNGLFDEDNRSKVFFTMS